jgi:hypothetical protein
LLKKLPRSLLGARTTALGAVGPAAPSAHFAVSRALSVLASLCLVVVFAVNAAIAGLHESGAATGLVAPTARNAAGGPITPCFLHAVNRAAFGVAAALFSKSGTGHAAINGITGDEALTSLGAVATADIACGPGVENGNCAVNGANLGVASLCLDKFRAYGATSGGTTGNLPGALLRTTTTSLAASFVKGPIGNDAIGRASLPLAGAGFGKPGALEVLPVSGHNHPYPSLRTGATGCTACTVCTPIRNIATIRARLFVARALPVGCAAGDSTMSSFVNDSTAAGLGPTAAFSSTLGPLVPCRVNAVSRAHFGAAFLSLNDGLAGNATVRSFSGDASAAGAASGATGLRAMSPQSPRRVCTVHGAAVGAAFLYVGEVRAGLASSANSSSGDNPDASLEATAAAPVASSPATPIANSAVLRARVGSVARRGVFKVRTLVTAVGCMLGNRPDTGHGASTTGSRAGTPV